MPVYYDKDKKRWRFSFNRIVASKRTRATKLLPAAWSRTQAEKYDREETSRLYAIATGVHRPEPTIGTAVSLYLDHRVPALRNGRKVARDLAFLVDYIAGRQISALPDVAREYVKDHPELADGTIHNRLAYLKSACRYAWKKHALTEFDPTGRMEIPQPNNKRDVQTPVSRVEQLLDALRLIDIESCAVFTLAFRTGTRWIKGIHARQPGDVVHHGRDVWLRIGVTKNGAPREKWVHPDARWALKYLPFKRRPEYYYDRFCKARALVGLDGLWAHDMRHVVGTDIRRRGGSLEDVGAALDHISHTSSARYAHVTPGQIKRVLSGVGRSRKVHTGSRRKRQQKAA